MKKQKKKLITLVVSMILFPIITNAETKEKQIERPQKEILEPEMLPIESKDGSKYGGYQLKDLETLGNLIEDYHTLYNYAVNCEQKIASLERENLKLKIRADMWKKEASDLKIRGDIMLANWKSQQKIFIENEKENRKKIILPWGLSAAELVVNILLIIFR